jgi:hypothetical protein
MSPPAAPARKTPGKPAVIAESRRAYHALRPLQEMVVPGSSLNSEPRPHLVQVDFWAFGTVALRASIRRILGPMPLAEQEFTAFDTRLSESPLKSRARHSWQN